MQCIHRHVWQVYDGSAEDGAPPNFVIVEELPSYWEVPLEGAGPPDNPVPGPVGQVYAGAMGNGMDADAGFGAPLPEDAFGAPIPDDAFGTADEHTLNGAMDYVRGDHFVSVLSWDHNRVVLVKCFVMGGHHVRLFQVPAPPPDDNPRAAAMRDMQRQRLKDQEQLEVTRKAKLRDEASEYLASFYARRQEKKDSRRKENRDKLTPAGDVPEGNTPWERVISMIDFQFAKCVTGCSCSALVMVLHVHRPSADMSRFKSTLYLAKGKNMATS